MLRVEVKLLLAASMLTMLFMAVQCCGSAYTGCREDASGAGFPIASIMDAHLNATLRVWTGKPAYSRGEIVDLYALFTVDGEPVENATVLFEVATPEWMLIYMHDFRWGHAPGWYGWGEFRLTGEGLILSPGECYAGVYFTPTHHGSEFMIETTFMFLNRTGEGFLEAQILTRDSVEIIAESGMAIQLEADAFSARHMVNGTEYLYRWYSLPEDITLELNVWYNMRFAYRNGTVYEWLDGRRILYEPGGYPAYKPGYNEPHIAVYNGEILFRQVKVYEPAPEPNSTYAVVAAQTNSEGLATARLLIDVDAIFGDYVVYAVAYKPGLPEAEGEAEFSILPLKPMVEVWFTGLRLALVGLEANLTMHIKNLGDGAAVINATLRPPDNVKILYANTSHHGLLDAGEEVKLSATVISDKPLRCIFRGYLNYTRLDGTPMPPKTVNHTLLYTYHPEYPVDLLNMTVASLHGEFAVNVTLINYGDLDVTVLLAASAMHKETYLTLKSSFEYVTVKPGEVVVVNLSIKGGGAPKGSYIIQAILATDLPRNRGIPLTYLESEGNL